MEKKIRVMCDIGVGGERGRVFDPKGLVGALSSTDYKDPPKTIKKIQKPLDSVYVIENALTNERTNEVVVLGGIGRNDRKNRDGFRVLSGKGIIYSLISHTSSEPPLVLKKWKKDLT